MGIVKATAYPHRYAQQDVAVMEKPEAKLNCFSPQLCFPSVSCMEAAAHEERDKLFIQFSVIPKGYPRQEQRKIAQIIARSLRVKCTFQKPETIGDSHPTIYDHGSYTAAGWYVEDYSVASNWFTLGELSRVLVVLKALSDYRPDGKIQIHYIPERFDISMLMNVCTILEARRPLVEQALGLKEELKITVTEYLTFSVPLDVSACQKRSHKAAFFDIMGTGDENDEARNGTAAGNRDAMCGHVDAKGSFAAEDRRSGGFYAHL